MTIPATALVGLMRFAEEAEEKTINPVLPVSNEVFWSAVFFFALLGLMRYVLLPPIMAGREQRAARVNAGKDSVSDSESELAQIKAAHQARIAAAKGEAAGVIDEARAEAEGQRATAVAAVEEEISRLRAGTQSEIDSARANALSQSRGAVSQLAVGAASKVLGSAVDLTTNQSIIDTYLNGRQN